MSTLRHLLFFYLVTLMMHEHTTVKYIIRIVCFGERLRLNCKVGRTLEIHKATYEMLHDKPNLCHQKTNRELGCGRSQVLNSMQRKCNGRERCSLGYGIKDDINSLNCHTSMYFNVSYRCTWNKTQQQRPKINSDNLSIFVSENKSKVNPNVEAAHGKPVSRPPYKPSLYFVIVTLFLDFHLAGVYVSQHTLWLILCTIASFAVGILLLIIYALLFKLCTKNQSMQKSHERERLTKPDEKTKVTTSTSTDVNFINIERESSIKPVKAPTFEASPKQPTTPKQPTSPKTPKNGHIHHQLISTNRRMHSVDEQTQTYTEDVHSVSSEPTGTVSVDEILELGHLVNDLKRYDSQTEDPVRIGKKVSTGSSIHGSRNSPTFFISDDPSMSSSRDDKQIETYGNYSIPFPTGTIPFKSKQFHSPQREHNNAPVRGLRRFPSELSYTTSASTTSNENEISKECYFLGEPNRMTSMKRNQYLGITIGAFDFNAPNT